MQTAIAGNGSHITAAQQQPVAPVVESSVQRSVVTLRPIPHPDVLELTLPARHICLITDDGTPLTPRLCEELTRRGLRVIVLSFPTSLVASRLPLPASVTRVALDTLDETHLAQALQTITSTYGPIGAFVHTNPPYQPHQQNGGNGSLFSETEKEIVRHVFLLSKHLKHALQTASQHGHACFLTVARLDGQFGLGQQADFGAIGGGLFGLTKTLNLEWESVFCRSVDVAASIHPEAAACHIVAELYDPNRLIAEVGYGAQGRVTLVGV